jgi:hypothetical protein
MAMWRMRFARWIIEVTDTHSEYEIFDVFPQQKWVRECATLLQHHLFS